MKSNMNKKIISSLLSASLALFSLPLFATDANALEAEKQAVLSEIGASGYASDSVIVKFKDDVESQKTEEVLLDASSLKSKDESQPSEIADNTAVVDLAEGSSVVDAIVELNHRDDVEYAEPDYVVELDDDISLSTVNVNDTYVDEQWNLNDDNANIQGAWDLITSDNNVTVAVIDSGADASNPDLVNNIIGGRSFLSDDESDADNWEDTLGHGTGVAGVISARTNNSLNISGVSYNANLLICRAFSDKNTKVSNIVKALHWVTSVATDYNVKVVNMSLGLDTGTSTPLEEAINEAVDAGLLCVCASGNQGSIEGVNFPASLDKTVSVGSINSRHQRNTTSNGGDNLDVVAPGSGILTLGLNSSNVTSSGTSFATPFVSAVAALCAVANPNASWSDIKSYLTGNAVDIGDEGKDEKYGWGQVNAYESVFEAIDQFSDIDHSTYHADDILWMRGKGITTGFSDGTFRPYDNIARCDMAAFLYRMMGSPADEISDDVKSMFSDVDEETPHAEAIWWMASMGITTGFEDGTFRPYETVKRCDMAAFLYRTAQIKKVSTTGDGEIAFRDVDEETPHYSEIVWLADKGISTGFPDGTFRPFDEVARCDMAAFLKRTCSLINK